MILFILSLVFFFINSHIIMSHGYFYRFQTQQNPEASCTFHVLLHPVFPTTSSLFNSSPKIFHLLFLLFLHSFLPSRFFNPPLIVYFPSFLHISSVHHFSFVLFTSYPCFCSSKYPFFTFIPSFIFLNTYVISIFFSKLFHHHKHHFILFFSPSIAYNSFYYSF